MLPRTFTSLLFTTVVAAVSSVVMSSGVVREATFVSMQSCITDQAQSVVKSKSRLQCSLTCNRQVRCRDFNFDDATGDCSLYLHQPLFYNVTPECTAYKKEEYAECLALGPDVPSTIPSQCCAVPFTFNGSVRHGCVDDGGGVGCFYGDRQWKLCRLPADFEEAYEETATRALSANSAVIVPLLTINRWILMQRKVTGGSVSFEQDWAAYRDGFGSPTGNDNYWLGLEKVYRLMQLGGVRLRVEIQLRSGEWRSAEYSSFSISDELGKYRLTVDGYSGDAGNALMTNGHERYISNGMMFSTWDSDNDLNVDYNGGNCAASMKGGWWYHLCSLSLLNRQRVKGKWKSSTPNVQFSRMLVKIN